MKFQRPIGTSIQFEQDTRFFLTTMQEICHPVSLRGRFAFVERISTEFSCLPRPCEVIVRKHCGRLASEPPPVAEFPSAEEHSVTTELIFLCIHFGM